MDPRVLCDVQPLIADPRTPAPRIAWRLSESGRQLDANLVNLPADQGVGTHTEGDLDVLMVVLAGNGTMETVQDRVPIAAGQLVWLPRGSTRSLFAGSGGLSYLTLHQRRPGMRIASSRRAEPGPGQASDRSTSIVHSGLGPAEAEVGTTTVTDHPETSRYQLTLDGTLVGFVEYHLHENVFALLHTEIVPALRGRGLGEVLVRATLDDVRARGLRVQPFCGFARDVIADNAEYHSLVAAEDRPRFRL